MSGNRAQLLACRLAQLLGRHLAPPLGLAGPSRKGGQAILGRRALLFEDTLGLSRWDASAEVTLEFLFRHGHVMSVLGILKVVGLARPVFQFNIRHITGA
jgi:hypothetical protein